MKGTPINGNFIAEFSGLFQNKFLGLEITTEYLPEEFSNAKATVIEVCSDQKVRRDLNIIRNVLLPGDEVYIDSSVAQERLGNVRDYGRNIHESIISIDPLRAIVPIASVYALVRNGDLQAMPGYVLCEDVEEEREIAGLKISTETGKSVRRHRVVSVGENALANLYEPEVANYNYNLKPGDVVVFDFKAKIQMQYNLVSERPLYVVPIERLSIVL